MKKVLSNVFLSFAVLIFVSAVAFVAMSRNSADVFIFGYKPFIIATGSMETEYMARSLVIIKQGGYDTVQIGDVIAFKSDALGNKLAFHRVVQRVDGGFVTKGDNNSSNDGFLVTRANFIGHKVFHTNWTAHYMRELHKPYGILRVVILPIIALVLLLIGIALFRGWDANVWLKRLVTSSMLLVICVTALISYITWDNQRVTFLNERLGSIANDFITQTDRLSAITVNNYPVIGVIAIPVIDIRYPIIKYDGYSSLDTSINHYSGPSLNEIGNVVLAGHYSAMGGNLFFTNINKLNIGDIATIIDDNGHSVDYRVTDSGVYLPNDLSILETEQSDKKELTLFSCTADLRNRYVVKLVAAE